LIEEIKSNKLDCKEEKQILIIM